jgi:DHA2 family multidrug resistance protein
MALTLFLLGSVLCGMSWNINSMVAARVIQALGGGVLQPISMAMIFKECPRSKIGMVLGVWGISAMAAPAIGPTLGGYLVEYANWRMIFYINLPIGIINLFLAAANLKETELIRGKYFDLLGVIFSTTGFLSLLLALSKGASEGWTLPYIVTLLTIAIVSLVALTINELRHPEPILELRLFKNFLFSLSNIIGAILAIGLFGAIFLMPILIQNVLGQTAMKSGLITLPSAIASGLMMPVSGKIFDKHGARVIAIIGLVITTWTTYIMSGFNLITPFAAITFWLAIRGAGMGLCMMPVTTAGMNTVPPHLVGKASALSNVVRQVSASFGIAILTTILQKREAFHFANLAQSVNMNSSDAFILQGALQDMAVHQGLSYGTAQGAGLGLIAQRVTLLSMVNAISDCFIIAAGMCLIALLLCFLLKDKKKTGEPAASSPVIKSKES